MKSRNMRRYRFMTGEGLTFGIPEGNSRGVFTAARFPISQEMLTLRPLKAAYFTGKNASRKVVRRVWHLR